MTGDACIGIQEVILMGVRILPPTVVLEWKESKAGIWLTRVYSRSNGDTSGLQKVHWQCGRFSIGAVSDLTIATD